LKASSFLLDPDAQRPAYVEVRGAKRLFADCLAARLDADRQLSIHELFERASRQRLSIDFDLERAFALSPTDRKASRALVVDLVTAALDVLDSLVIDVAAPWNGKWNETVSAGRVDDASVIPVAEAALREGFVHAAQVSRLGDASMLLVVPPPGSARDHVARHVRLLETVQPLRRAANRWAPRPVLTTPGLWQAAVLFDPPPFVGALLATRTYSGWGSQPPVGPAKPSQADWTELLETRILHQFQRARARAFRQGKPEDALAREVLTVGPEYDRFASCVWDVSAPPAEGEWDQGQLLRVHWDWMEGWRQRLSRGANEMS